MHHYHIVSYVIDGRKIDVFGVHPAIPQPGEYDYYEIAENSETLCRFSERPNKNDVEAYIYCLENARKLQEAADLVDDILNEFGHLDAVSLSTERFRELREILANNNSRN